ncbi:MAG: DUF2786 domain-containing protein [Polyangiaceae bacterium]|nr:DUF2786 domain-containing protein [Polyangiaceae bacterium]
MREALREWHRLNEGHFRRALQPPALVFSDVPTRLGRFYHETRTLELARSLALEHPWSVLVEVLKHEMAHQYVLEVLQIEDESAHGPAFREVCERLGIDARASGLPNADPQRTEEEDRILGRIARLLALAESSSVHEAESAMKAAQRLMLKYNLEQATVATKQRGTAYSFRTLGKPTGRVSEAERMLATILGAHFFVEVIWVPVYRPLEQKHGSVLEICGTVQNLEMASYVHSFLLHASEQLWLDHKKERGIRSNRDRRTYLAGVMSGFYAKLNADKKAQQKEGLVWVGDAELRGYYRKRHPHVVTVRYGGSARNDAHAEGRAAGQKLILHRPITKGPSNGGPKLLGR